MARNSPSGNRKQNSITKEEKAAFLQAQLDHHRSQRNGDVAMKFIDSIKTVTVVGFIAWAIRSLAGKQTGLDIKHLNKLLDLFSKDLIVCFVLTITAVLGILYGLVQKSLRESNIKRSAKRIDDLEKKIDPGKSSSNLLENGNTPKEGIR